MGLPQFQVYNLVLRRWPAKDFEALGGNHYCTTIYCLVSGVTKVVHTDQGRAYGPQRRIRGPTGVQDSLARYLYDGALPGPVIQVLWPSSLRTRGPTTSLLPCSLMLGVLCVAKLEESGRVGEKGRSGGGGACKADVKEVWIVEGDN